MYSVTIVWSAFAFIHLRLVPPHPTPNPPPLTSMLWPRPAPPLGAVERPAIFGRAVPPTSSPPPSVFFIAHTLNVIYWHCFNCKDIIIFFVVLKGKDTVDKRLFFRRFIWRAHTHTLKCLHRSPGTSLWGALTVGCVCVVGGGGGEERFEQQQGGGGGGIKNLQIKKKDEEDEEEKKGLLYCIYYSTVCVLLTVLVLLPKPD